jgi:hypothetical protein
MTNAIWHSQMITYIHIGSQHTPIIGIWSQFNGHLALTRIGIWRPQTSPQSAQVVIPWLKLSQRVVLCQAVPKESF